MATIRAVAGGQPGAVGLDMTNMEGAFGIALFYMTRLASGASSTGFSLTGGPGTHFAGAFTGIGLTYDEAIRHRPPMPATGTITDFRVTDLDGVQAGMVATGLSASVEEIRERMDWEVTSPVVGIRALMLSGDDLVVGSAAADILVADHGHDRLQGGRGNDQLEGGRGDDTLEGGAGSDTLSGNDGNDVLQGGAGSDVLGWDGYLHDGERGDNRFAGGAGWDTMYGGSGRDAFVFDVAPPLAGVDTIQEFDSGADAIWLDADAFRGIGRVGALGAHRFREGVAAADATDRVIFHEATGRLWFDADGTGGRAQVLIARLDGGTDLDAADVLVV